MQTYNRKDNDAHKYLIPEDLLAEFDRLMDIMCDYDTSEDDIMDAESEFCIKFTKFMVG